MVLNIFDFDGTLFGSPGPISTYKGRSQGGWWADSVSLSSPCVPEIPDMSWWNTPIVALASKSISSPNTLTILMTGRSNQNGALRFRVAELLQQANLNFDRVYLKTGDYSSTMAFKVATISAILDRNPDITEMHIWDDRHNHLPSFIEAAEDAGVDGMAHPVTRFEHEHDCSPEEFSAMLSESKLRDLIKLMCMINS